MQIQVQQQVQEQGEKKGEQRDREVGQEQEQERSKKKNKKERKKTSTYTDLNETFVTPTYEKVQATSRDDRWDGYEISSIVVEESKKFIPHYEVID